MFINILFHGVLPAGIMMLIGTIIDAYLGWKLGSVLILIGIIYLPVWFFRAYIWDFKKTFFNFQDFFIRKTHHRIVGSALGIIAFFLLLVTIGCFRPNLNHTYRYKQVDYEVGDTVLVGDKKYIADGLYEAKVVDVKEATFSDGSHDPIFYHDEYTLDTGETIPRSRIFGMRERMNDILWIPKSYYYGSKYLITSWVEFVKLPFS